MQLQSVHLEQGDVTLEAGFIVKRCFQQNKGRSYWLIFDGDFEQTGLWIRVGMRLRMRVKIGGIGNVVGLSYL